MDAWGFPKIGGTVWAVPNMRGRSILGFILGSLILGNCHVPRINARGRLGSEPSSLNPKIIKVKGLGST